jgi:hypothetical protein
MAVSPLMVCVLIPPVRLGVVGRPWKPPNMAACSGRPDTAALAGKDMGETQASLEERGRRDGPGVAERSVLIDDVNVAVAVAAGGPGEVGRVILQVLALAETQERGHAIVDLAVELGVEFVAVVADEQQRLVIVGASGAVGGRQPGQDRGGERIQLRHRDLRVGGINHAGQRVDHRHGEDPWRSVMLGMESKLR